MSSTKTAPGELSTDAPADIAAEWVRDLSEALAKGSASELERLFTEVATWRDFMAFQWDVSNRIGRDALVPFLLGLAADVNPRDFALTPLQEPALYEENIQAFFDFKTKDRVCRGYVFLVPNQGGFIAQTLQTQANGLQDFPESTGENRQEGKHHGLVMDRTRWLEDRAKQAAFEDSDPAVVILGAGHNGLALAARLKALDVPTLVIERKQRIGDTWRQRYASLALHSIIHVDHMPYVPFPPTWTSHTPKDKYADFLESYAKLLDLNVWTGTTFENASYGDETGEWTINIKREDGSIRELHPRHFIVASGVNGPPKIPAVEGLDTFAGEWAHSGEYQRAADWTGRKVLVIGSGVSAHEMSHDLYEHGADVTMVQRGATYVITFETFNKLWFGLYTEDQQFPVELADQIAYSLPNVSADAVHRQLVELAKEEDKELLDALEARGFTLEWGPEGTGIIGLHMSGRDSYQIDIGASALVADGRVKLKSGVELAEVRGNTAIFTDASTVEGVDLILFATGYHQLWDYVKPLLGGAAANIDKVYGRAPDGEYANTWRPTSQPGLWFATGFVGMARFHSKFTTLAIKAMEEGLTPVRTGGD
jgi:putative flavoprotein involved in K+ transport